MGRPTKRTPEVEAAIVEALAAGRIRKVAAAAGGISYATLREWELAFPEFAESIQNAEEKAKQDYLDLILGAAKTGAMVQRRDGTIIHEPGQWQAAAWLLERRWPQEYARRTAVELTGKDGGPVEHREVAGLADHEREALATAIRAHLRGAEEPQRDPA